MATTQAVQPAVKTATQPTDLTQALIQKNQKLEQKVKEQEMLLGLLLGGDKATTKPVTTEKKDDDKGLITTAFHKTGDVFDAIV